MKTAVTYARFSCSHQQETSIEAQRDAMARWCASRGVEIVAEYADRAVSGTSVAKRDAFLQMLADLKTRRVDYVLVHKYDRFARNQNDQYFYMAMIERRGAKLVAVAQEFGDGPEARFMLGVIAAYNAFYSENLASEVRKGRAVVIKNGKYPGGVIPFGYVSDGSGSFALDEVEAYFVRRMFDVSLTRRERMDQVLLDAREAGVMGRRGRPLTLDSTIRIRRNPIYAGVFQHKLPDGEIVRIENHHPAIVTIEEYEEVQRIMDRRINSGRPDRETHLLTGLTYCGVCGGKMYAVNNPNNGYDYRVYFCGSKCIRRIRCDELEQAAIDYLNDLFSAERRAQLREAVTSYVSRMQVSVQRRKPSTDREIKKLRREVDALVANMASGVLDPDTLSALSQQISQRRARIRVLEESITPPPPAPVPDIDEYFADAVPLSLDMDPQLLRRIIHKYIARVTVHTTEIEIDSTFEAWFADQLIRLRNQNLQSPTSGPTYVGICTKRFFHRSPIGGRGRLVPRILTDMENMHKVSRHDLKKRKS